MPVIESKRIPKMETFLFRSGSIYAEVIELENFTHMQEVLGGECFAIQFPKDILLWCTNQRDRPAIDHTLSIVKDGHKAEYFGNLLFTSNDDEKLEGINFLSVEQTKWLSENFRMGTSPLHGNFVFEFFIDNEEQDFQ